MLSIRPPTFNDVVQGLQRHVWAPLQGAPWADWRDFWLQQILDDRFVVVYFLPLVPLLLLARGRALHWLLVCTSLVFATYLFGALYAAAWLVTALCMFRLGERFAREVQRSDVMPVGPPLAAWVIVGGWYVVTMLLDGARLPAEVNDWLYAHARWVYPLGTRGWAAEADFGRLLARGRDAAAPQLLSALFWDVHYVGTAYLAMRMLHYLADIRRGALPAAQRSLLGFLSWTCYGPTLIQGPIERYQRFQEELATCHTRRSRLTLRKGFTRIVMGLGKSVISTLYLQPLLTGTFGLSPAMEYYRRPEDFTTGVLYLGVFFQIFTLYMEFSGYCDVAIGLSGLFGLRLTENFAMPWLATSIRDFWRRWHITLSLILRDYIYIPLGGNRRHATWNVCVTFALCGLWHRIVLQVAVWGLLMGLMIAVNQRWVAWMRRLDEVASAPAEAGALQRALAGVRRGWVRVPLLPTLCAWLVTQHAFVFSLLIFFGGAGGIRVGWELLRRLLGLGAAAE